MSSLLNTTDSVTDMTAEDLYVYLARKFPARKYVGVSFVTIYVGAPSINEALVDIVFFVR